MPLQSLGKVQVTLALWCGVVALGAFGCGGTAFFSAAGEGSGTSDAGVDAGGVDGGGTDGGGTDGGILDGGATTAGFITLSHISESDGYAWESLSLHAQFFPEPYDPEANRPDYVETRATPDGISCDIFYQSGMGGGEPPPPPPAQIDGGRIQAGGAAGSNDALEVVFDGQIYDVDSRPNSTHSLPPWLVGGAIDVAYRGYGSATILSFQHEAVLPAMPGILAPTPEQQPYAPGPDGNFPIRWQATPADQILVRFEFNLDWDNSAFICYPPAGVEQLSLPQAWINDWTWGSGSLAITARNQDHVSDASAAIVTRTSRITRRGVSFHIEW
jgi:hypothetical protein